MDGRDRLSVVTLKGDILFTLEVRPYVIPIGIDIAYLRDVEYLVRGGGGGG